MLPQFSGETRYKFLRAQNFSETHGGGAVVVVVETIIKQNLGPK